MSAKRLFRSETPSRRNHPLPPAQRGVNVGSQWLPGLNGMPESVEAGAGRPGRSASCFEFSYPEGGKQGRGRWGLRDPRQSRNCLCSGTGSSAEAATGWVTCGGGGAAGGEAGLGWAASRAGGTGRRLSQQRMEPAYSGR